MQTKKDKKFLKFIFIFIGVLIALILIVGEFDRFNELDNQFNQDISEPIKVETPKKSNDSISQDTVDYVKLNISQELIDYYQQLNEKDYIIGLRKIFDEYYKTGLRPACADEMSFNAREVQGYKSGIKSFDKSYFQSKFVVISEEPSPVGGMLVEFMFISKPDRVFFALITDENNCKYLRIFGQKGIPQEEFELISYIYSDILVERFAK